MPPSKNALLEGPILRSLLTLAVPIVLANILQAGYQLIDAFWVGRLGGAAVAAVSLSFPVMFLMFAVGAGLSIAGSTLIAQYVGARNDEMVSHVAGQTLLMVVIVSLVLGTVGYIFAPDLLRAMGVAPDVYGDALKFLRVSFVAWCSISPSSSSRRSCAHRQATLPVYIVAGTVVSTSSSIRCSSSAGDRSGLRRHGRCNGHARHPEHRRLIGIVVLRWGQHGIHVRRRDFIPTRLYQRFPSASRLDRAVGARWAFVLSFLIASRHADARPMASARTSFRS